MLRFALPSIPSRPALPAPARTAAAARRRFGDTRVLFAVGLVVPTLVAAIYFGLFASGRYVSEADFVVRGANQRRVSGLDMLFQSFGLSRAVDDANAVQTYLLSRDALQALAARWPLRDWFGPERADLLSRFPRPWGTRSDEQLYDYYRDRVSVIQNASKGITTLRVEAFDPGQAQAIAANLLDLAESHGERHERPGAGRRGARRRRRTLDAARDACSRPSRRVTTFRTREAPDRPGVDLAVGARYRDGALDRPRPRRRGTRGGAGINTGASPSLPALQSRDASRSPIAIRQRTGADRGRRRRARAARRGLRAPGARPAARREEPRGRGLRRSRRRGRRPASRAVYIERVVSPQRPDEASEPERLRTDR